MLSRADLRVVPTAPSPPALSTLRDGAAHARAAHLGLRVDVPGRPVGAHNGTTSKQPACRSTWSSVLAALMCPC